MDAADLVGACFGPQDEGWFAPHALLQGYRRKARALGVTYLEDEATAIDRERDRVTGVQLKKAGRVGAGIVVNAAGAVTVAKLAATADIAGPVAPRRPTLFLADCRTPPPG